MITIGFPNTVIVTKDHTDAVYHLLADASQGTVDPDRALDIAQRAVAEACDNREGK